MYGVALVEKNGNKSSFLDSVNMDSVNIGIQIEIY